MSLKYSRMNISFSILTVVCMLFQSRWSVVGFPVENQDRPLNISVNMIIEDINSLNPLTMDFRLEFYLTQKWTLTTKHCQSTYQSIQGKERIETQNNPIVLKGNDLTNIWLPDAFLYNAKQVGPTTFDDGFKSLIVQFDGLNGCSFTYSLRLSALIPCPMNFRWFPVDKQVCRVSIRSGSYPSYQIVYSWLPKGVIVETKVPLLQHSLKMNYFQMNATVHDQALFTWLIVDLTFTRIISYHVIQIYLPTIILMVISYCSLWMGNDIVAGRITLGVTTQLALITQFSGLKSRLPQVSYINALDVWMVSCMLFVFSTIIVTTVIIFINRHAKELTKQMQIDQTKSTRLNRVENSWLNKVSSYADNHQSCISNNTKLDNINHKDSINYTIQSFDPTCDYENSKLTINDYSEKIDVSLRFIYPLTFLLFNTLYWITILIST